MKLGAARRRRLVEIDMDKFHVPLHAQPAEAAQGASRRTAVSTAHRERSRVVVAVLLYIQLVAVEQAFRNLKGNSATERARRIRLSRAGIAEQ